MNILLWLNKTRTNSKGKAPLMLRITYNKRRVNTSTGIKLELQKWDSAKQRVKGSDALTKEQNNLLHTLKSKVISAYDELLKEESPFSVEQILEKYQGVEQQQLGYVEVFDMYIKTMEAKIGTDYAKGTVTKYKSSRKNLKLFIKRKLKKKDVPIHMVNRRFVAQLDDFLRAEQKFCNNYVNKCIEQIRKVYKYCRFNGWVSDDPFDFYTFKRTETHKEFLSMDELNRLIAHKPSNQKLEETKDVFLFMCFTGLAHTDARSLSTENIVTGIDGKLWIQLYRAKTDTRISIPVLPMAKQVIDKYDHFREENPDRLLPVRANQVLNRNLKELMEEAKIKKYIASHSGRYTFASTVLLGTGVNVEVAQKLLAHNSIRSTMVYAKLSDQAIADHVDNLRSCLQKKLG